MLDNFSKILEINKEKVKHKKKVHEGKKAKSDSDSATDEESDQASNRKARKNC